MLQNCLTKDTNSDIHLTYFFLYKQINVLIFFVSEFIKQLITLIFLMASLIFITGDELVYSSPLASTIDFILQFHNINY